MRPSTIFKLLPQAFVALAAAATFLFAPVAYGDGFTNEQIQELLNELKLIRQALEKQAAGVAAAPGAPADDKVSMTMPPTNYAVGREDAPLVMVEYTDYQCPFCQQFHNAAWDELKRNYIDTGKVRFVTRDFPLDFHENARRAAVAARCGAEQGKFWELRHVLIVNADKLQGERLVGYAKDVGLNTDRFSSCLLSDKYKEDIDKSYAEGLAAGISGTPSFVLGRVNNNKLEGVRLVGAMPYAAFDSKIREMLQAN